MMIGVGNFFLRKASVTSSCTGPARLPVALVQRTDKNDSTVDATSSLFSKKSIKQISYFTICNFFSFNGDVQINTNKTEIGLNRPAGPSNLKTVSLAQFQ